MNIVTFPGLNLKFEFSKVAFTLFGVAVYKYAVCIVLGIAVAFILAKLSKEKFEIDFDNFMEVSILAAFLGILGARIYYVLFNLHYYSKNILEIFNFRNGGLAIYGGLIFGGITVLVYSKIKKIDVLNLLDYIVPYIAIAQFFGRFGNFFNVEAYGYETTSFLRMGINTINGYQEVHPVFLYEAIINLLNFILLRIMQKNRKFKGEIFLLYCSIYSFFRFYLENLRTDSLFIYNFRVSRILSLIIFITSVILFTKKYRELSKKNSAKKE